MAQKVTRSLILISEVDLMRARRESRARAGADVFRVYCAVVANDSRIRRAIFSRIVEPRGPGLPPPCGAVTVGSGLGEVGCGEGPE